MRKTNIAMIFMMLFSLFVTGCSGQAAETTTEEATTAKIEMTKLDWEIPVIELGEEYTFYEDAKEYVSLNDDAMYEQVTVKNNVDLSTPGDYTITVSGFDQEYNFPVKVQDTTYPEMGIQTNTYIVPLNHNVTADELFVSHQDNDEQAAYGYYGLEKIGELDEFSYEDSLEEVPAEYTQKKLEADVDIVSELSFEEEGIYQAYAVVADRSGNAVTALVKFIVDGTGPEIKLPKESVSIRLDAGFDFFEGVTCEDNVFPADECQVVVNGEDFDSLTEKRDAGETGTYTLRYHAVDPIGNESVTELEVTLTKKESSKPSTPPAENNSGEEANGGNEGGQPDVTSDAQFLDDMAKAAFDIINQYREDNGIPQLSWDNTLAEYAKNRAQEIVGTFSHNRPDGSWFTTALGDIGIYHYTAENIASGCFSAQDVADGWYNSEGHRENMLNDLYSYGAIACYKAENGNYYWVNLFYD